MTNRARPTWPEGAADSSKSQRTAQGGTPSAAPANPASNGRSNGVPGANGQRTGPPNGRRPSESRPQARRGPRGVARVRPQQPAPSTRGRPEPWSPPPTTTPAAGTPSYGETEAKTESLGD